MNALVSYASDSDSDSNEGLTTTIVEQKTVPPNTVSTPPPITTSSATPSKHQTSEDTPETRTPDLQEEADTQQDSREEHQRLQPDENDDEDDFVSAALKDLQSFAASVDDSTASAQVDDAMVSEAVPVEDPSLSTATAIAAVSGAQPSRDSDQFDTTDMDVDQPDTASNMTTATATVPQSTTPIDFTAEQQIIFDSFLQEISAIPLLPLPSTDQPPLPPRTSSHDPSSASTSKSTPVDDDGHWIQAQTPQTIYSRIHQLSTLPKTERFNPKEVENRLIEFAIRLLDWEQGGLKHVYFLGEERASRELESRRRKEEEEKKVSGESSDDDEEDESESGAGRGGSLPRYGGVVGEMIEFMYAVEKIAPPDDHWSVVWSLKELSYGFCHPATGMQSEEYPSTELRNRLNPPSSSSETKTPITDS
ncbi:hypothetical protein BG015_000977 [Linnemannia schmuckeri]|uniref:Uncharacterized protein n=1 Tax=Linnemannia schmuckeri TaxID=64567 RepID=A0A9P5VDK5_9FUNG|nr:hypothetical protein BG015_000977 [Linnemannia schmuckeri]